MRSCPHIQEIVSGFEIRISDRGYYEKGNDANWKVGLLSLIFAVSTIAAYAFDARGQNFAIRRPSLSFSRLLWLSALLWDIQPHRRRSHYILQDQHLGRIHRLLHSIGP
jgi:hypothetical protein